MMGDRMCSRDSTLTTDYAADHYLFMIVEDKKESADDCSLFKNRTSSFCLDISVNTVCRYLMF